MQILSNLAKTNVSDIYFIPSILRNQPSATEILILSNFFGKELEKLEIRSTKISDLQPLSETNMKN